jgi:glutamate carboxypeptidase
VAIEDGISAIEELAYKILELKKLTDIERGITVNVGTVEGGVNTNVVAPHAAGTIHIGFRTVQDYQEVMEKVRRIFQTSFVPGTRSTVRGGKGFLPMERHSGVLKLFEIVTESASLLNMRITEKDTGGAADAGFPASMGIPTICGMGPVGGGWHSPGEYMVMDTFIPRIQLLALSVALASNRLSCLQGNPRIKEESANGKQECESD